ncbi:beta-lactamase superfamily domain-domain-containing protein [Clohesyomyces aquaticus]|uniref:Beta-lactamase superfamily domain-domain-containing protein n=1 Tax=Clohesyomyces aquaticus TaxID=1231657 RepID=A0A1Y1Z6U0_9PLEO|nr:beta-lactamase superfamily domain-domain-containing protein [Clohesyomyces aquaticus]
MPATTVGRLPAQRPLDYPAIPPHHVGNPPTSFINPWPSYSHASLGQLAKAKWFTPKNFYPVPKDRVGLPKVRKPDFGSERNGLKATWIGHASFLIETSTSGAGKERGVTILLDPVWSDRVGPFGIVGPVRFSPPPCEIEELPEVDVVCISHDHYDHLDSETLRKLTARRSGKLRFFCGLGVKAVLTGLGMGIKDEQVTEMDWWDGVRVEVEDVGSVELVCTPAQHRSGRVPWGFQGTLWCSWVVKEVSAESEAEGKKLFFAGDTGYCHVPTDDLPSHHSAPHPPCPAFSEVGSLYGPFDLALLPIGCFQPRSTLSGVHSSPEDSIAIHKNIRSKKSIGMHYGTFRGGLSQHFEPVTEPAARWRSAAAKEGLEWDKEVGLCDIGETVVV